MLGNTCLIISYCVPLSSSTEFSAVPKGYMVQLNAFIVIMMNGKRKVKSIHSAKQLAVGSRMCIVAMGSNATKMVQESAKHVSNQQSLL